MAIFSYALYRIAVSYNISPWKWITQYCFTIVSLYFAIGIIIAIIMVANHMNIQVLMNDKAFVDKANDLAFKMMPFELLIEFGVFYLFRLRIVKYVRGLDEADRIANTPPPSSPSTPKKEDQDFSYFR